MKSIRLNKVGIALSVAMLATLFLTNYLFYSFAMNTALVAALIVLHYAMFIHYRKSKNILSYAIYLGVLIAAVVLTLPAVTTGMAKNDIEAIYQVRVEESWSESRDMNSFHPFSSNHVYVFKAVNSSGETEWFSANPRNGTNERIVKEE
ncbi:hypothetical protein MKY84_03100 [Chryseomicrobium sp. FSL W7-1435]|uniref:hypothetical protein n=1 Tax=Chryseomicrobium sp. FSL W7-1435 TaxID=2921704 RepID=UPI003159A07A